MPRTETIPKRLKCKIHWYTDAIDQIPGPSAGTWRWSDVFNARHGTGTADAGLGAKLRDAGLVVKQSDGRYRTTETLAEYMREEHDIDMDRPVMGLTTSRDSSPSPEPELLVSPEDRPGSEGARGDSTTIYQAKLEEFGGAPAIASQVDQSGGEGVS